MKRAGAELAAQLTRPGGTVNMAPGLKQRVLLTLSISCPVAARGSEPASRVFPYQRAEEGRQLARDECKPLVVHFVPDSKLGGDQLAAFYRGPQRVPDALIEQVVIIAVPTESFRRFARELGITGEGGLRTISPYDMTAADQGSVSTIRTGFI